MFVRGGGGVKDLQRGVGEGEGRGGGGGGAQAAPGLSFYRPAYY